MGTYCIPWSEYTISGYIQSKTTLLAKIRAMEVLEAAMLDTMLQNLGGGVPASISAEIPQITLTSANITGNDPFFNISLARFNIPLFFDSMTVFVDRDGDGNERILSPVDYNSTTKVLAGMSSPVDFPNQVIKINVSYTVTPVASNTPNMAATVSYELDDGQIRIKTSFRSIAELTVGLNDLRKVKNIYINQFDGRASVAQDKRNFI